MTSITLASIAPDQQIDTIATCTHKQLRPRRGGQSFLALVLRDRTASVEARIWTAVQRLNDRFDRGDVVRVSARAKTYLDSLQLNVTDIARVEPNADELAHVLPRAHRDVDELDGFLEHLAGEVHDPQLRALLNALLGDDPLRARWRRAPATLTDHHAYLGGLLEHTVAVATLAEHVCQQHPQLDSDLLLCAAIVHDIGRTRELTYDTRLGLSDEGRLIGHLARGEQLLIERAGGIVDGDRLAQLLHVVRRHHGPGVDDHGYELPEALALARLNALDSDIKCSYEQRLSITRRAA